MPEVDSKVWIFLLWLASYVHQFPYFDPARHPQLVLCIYYAERALELLCLGSLILYGWRFDAFAWCEIWVMMSKFRLICEHLLSAIHHDFVRVVLSKWPKRNHSYCQDHERTLQGTFVIILKQSFFSATLCFDKNKVKCL